MQKRDRYTYVSIGLYCASVADIHTYIHTYIHIYIYTYIRGTTMHHDYLPFGSAINGVSVVNPEVCSFVDA